MERPENDLANRHNGGSPYILLASVQGSTVREAEIETTLDQIAARTIGVIAEHSRTNASEITRDTELNDIGLNSLELTEIVMDLEDLYDIDFSLNAAEAWDSLKKVGDVVDAIHELVSARD